MKSERTPVLDVLIAGRGPAGAALALALDRVGLNVALVGPPPPTPAMAPGGAAAAPWDARVYALARQSRELLESLHVWDLCDLERVAPVYGMQVYPDASADSPCLNFDAYGTGLDALAWIVEHRQLAQALERALRFRDIAVIDAEVDSIDVDLAQVRVGLRSSIGAGAGGASLREARLLVGADGAQSRVRTLAGLDGRCVAYDQIAVVANFLAEHSHRDLARQWFRPDGVLALLPLPLDQQRRGRVSMVWSASPELAQQMVSLPDHALATWVADASHGQLGQLELLTPARALPLSRMAASATVAPRVALLGDAAHVIHPMAGQGLNLGFGDVIDLARVLREREPDRDCGEMALLRRYARARAEPVLRMTIATDGLHRLFYRLPTQISPLVRLGFQALDRLPALKRLLTAHAANTAAPEFFQGTP